MQYAALFDIDGTLVDSNYEHVQAWYRAFRRHGITVPEAWIHRSIGMGGDKLVPHLLRTDENDPRVRTLGDVHDQIFREEFLDGIQPLPAVSACVDHLRAAGYRIALATSAKSDELEHYIQLLQLEGRLDATVSKEDVAQTKPAPEIFAVACDRLGIEPERALAIGDSVWDAEAARHLGIHFLDVCTGGFDQREIEEAGAAAVYRDLPDLLAHWHQAPISREHGLPAR